MKNIFLLLVSFFYFVVSAQQTNFSFLNFTGKNGFNEKFVYTCSQDKDGYIWIGTGNGLYKYDGSKFYYIKSDIDTSTHQITSLLQVIYYDNFKDYLWLSSLNGFQYYDLKLKKFEGFNYDNSSIKEIMKNEILSFFRDSQNIFWITTKFGYWCKFDKEKQKITYFKPHIHNSKLSSITYKIIEIDKNNLWALTDNGISNFNKDRILSNYFNQEKKEFTKNTFYDGFYDRKRNCFWLATGINGIAKFDLRTKKFTYYPIVVSNSFKEEFFFINSITSSDEDTIYFGGSGFGKFYIESGAFKTEEVNYKSDYSFRTHKIVKLFKDQERNIWLCSHNGFSMVSWQNNQIKNLTLYHPKTKLNIEPLLTIKDNLGNWLIANDSSNGILMYDGKDFSIIESPNMRGKTYLTNGIVGLHKTKSGKIYASDEFGLYQYDDNKRTLNVIPAIDQNGKKIGFVTRIISDNSENLILSCPNNGVYYYDVDNKKLIHYNLWDINPKANKTINNLSARIVDRSNNVWFSMVEGGVYCYNFLNKSFNHYATGSSVNNKAKLIKSFDIAQSKNGSIWITTKDNGLYELKVEGKKEILNNYKTTTYHCRLPSNNCNKIVSDMYGNLWVGTLSGLVRINPVQHKTETVLSVQNGLPNPNIDVGINVETDGTLFINNYNILSVINTTNYNKNRLSKSIILNSFETNDEQKINDIKNNKIILNYTENYIYLTWSYLVLNNSSQNIFKYRLKGINKDWVNSYTNEVSYTSLPTGNTYNFEIIAENNDGIESKPYFLEIEIKNPFWKTWWFYTLLAIVLLSILYSFYYYKLQKIKLEEKLKAQFTKDLAQIEMKALRAQMNPHFIFNSLNSIQKFILKNDTFAASQYLTKFSKLIRLILDHSNQNYVQLSNEVEQLKLYTEIEALRFDNQFDYEFIVDNSIINDNTYIPSMIIQPYIENAIWHGLLHKETKGKLTVKIQKCNLDCVKVEVEDNGVGREKAQELKSKQVLKKKSYGMEITHNRIDILNKIENDNTICSIIDLKDERNIAIGTKVELIIPLKMNPL